MGQVGKGDDEEGEDWRMRREEKREEEQAGRREEKIKRDKSDKTK